MSCLSFTDYGVQWIIIPSWPFRYCTNPSAVNRRTQWTRGDSTQHSESNVHTMVQRARDKSSTNYIFTDKEPRCGSRIEIYLIRLGCNEDIADISHCSSTGLDLKSSIQPWATLGVVLCKFHTRHSNGSRNLGRGGKHGIYFSVRKGGGMTPLDIPPSPGSATKALAQNDLNI